MNDADALRARPRRLTVRAKLTLTYTALFTVAAAVMLALVYVFMRYVPTYAIRAAPMTAMELESAQWGTPSPAETADVAQGLSLSTTGSAALVVSDESDILNTLLLSSMGILVLLAGASAIAGWVISGRLLRPLQEIIIAAQGAANGSFDHRVALAGPRDEITELSDTIDHMLERLGRSFHAHRRFAANASHELRTPLATTQALLDVAAREQRLDEASVRELIAALRETNSRSVDTVEGILDLADLDGVSPTIEAVDLAAEAQDVVDSLASRAAQRHITIDTRLAPAALTGDRRLVIQLLSNLLLNAIRHNVEGGTIDVRTFRTGGPTGGAPTIEITNTGAVIPTVSLSRLTEPFYRGSGRVSTDERSHGLGLAIVDSIVDAHQGNLVLTANPGGGLRVRAQFPNPDGRGR